MRVLVTGAGGQLGRDLVDAFAGHDVTPLGHADLDVADEVAVAAAVAGHRPDLVVNAAAWTDVDGCESDPERAHRVNALGPWWLARACERGGATLVHVSTDYVFDGAALRGADGHPRGYTETDVPRPLNVHGRSKLAGEELVRATLREHHIVRTAWLAGGSGSNFVRTVLGLARERRELRIVDDQVGSPTTARDLAAGVREVAVSGRYGTVHLVNAGWCSRFELAAAVIELAGLDAALTGCSSGEFPRPAVRPAWSVLDTTHARASGLTPLPHWRDAVATLLGELGERGR